jgi:hypothetical protein
MASVKVVIKTATVGQNFGTVGLVCDARSGRKLAETADTYPLGFVTAARAGAEALAKKNGWTLTEVAS